ncbi:ABC transporter ATP-binding protein [Actinomarinicola tropica]|uniref:ATP-binding cassette domain-containing protein n=1 Tax=Actinomarinicola tropica TaxID=2789776 RepID=A0A5Q2RPX8_9ACTN|nr:ABC transporter ATP-binding protein [Actinomarinicola tropica]QGG96177.1 ATP-binding cassette domain-containing protein [Actinomarinicola tropica]
MSSIEIHDLSVSFGDFRAVDGLSADIAPGAWVGLIGPNGAGKSTLLRALLGLVAHDGRCTVDGHDARDLSRREVSRRLAFVPQSPSCPPDMAVADYVLLGRTPYIPHLGTESRHDVAVVADVLDRLDLTDFVGRRLGTLSGGELQRVVLARALAQQAPVLVLDEPTSALDIGHQQQVLELVEDLRHEAELTVISAMHDLTLAGQFADELLLMSNGRRIAMGPPTEVLTEHTIGEHYGASVRVLRDECGGIVVVPTRSHRTAGVGSRAVDGERADERR